MFRRTFLAALVAGLAGLSALPSAVQAQQYPDKPIRLVLPFPPGGVTDALARTLADKLGPRLGQPVVVENKPGAGTMLASEAVARAPADGYTLMMAASSLGMAPAIFPKVNYDPIKSFTPITLAAAVIHQLVVGPDVPANNVKELIEYMKANPGKVSYASTGNGTSTHLEAELFKSMADVQMVHIPYRGSGPALTDMIGGHVQLMFDAVGSSQPLVEAGKLRALAVTTAERSPSMPHLPTVAESGLPGFDAMPWLGILAPAGTPQPIVDRLYTELKAVLDDEALRKDLGTKGLDVVANTPAEFADFIAKDVEKWAGVVKFADIKAD
jgi:tripartite-type tricarboxylate transporter receptor subunit TctC